ncbi:Aspartyl-tRNA synthetase [Yasminevirus sp. GU-2018]|uniref:Aspartyl-tRNA synthetase n=1 Tax=Yasminevirus sp. GU-2018 TaxID=2420051 RepID=A0A5K0U898_9VIRU|nr:Aspartyl-tRNA synthetase [Yasminevirus sp. GU-2018]
MSLLAVLPKQSDCKAVALKTFSNECVSETLASDAMAEAKLQCLEALVSAHGFCHNIRVNKKMIFVVLRRETSTIQLIVFKEENPDEYETIKGLMNESTIQVDGVVVPAKVKTCTVTDYEVKIRKVTVLSSAKELPFGLDDANETFHSDSKQEEVSEGVEDELESARCKVSRQVRLDNRWIDLRIPMNQHIFRLRSAIEATIREVLISDDFVEIHTPKIIPAVSEGGSNVFDVNYFGQKVYLAQSPQLYKQMMINGGFEKVFEVGPVFRAENANTYRHLCEFTGLDFEFAIKPDGSHIDVINTIWNVLFRAYKAFVSRYQKQIMYVLERTGTEPLIFPETPVLIDFKEGCAMLAEVGVEQDPLDDIGSVNEKRLGELVKEKFGTDVYVLINFPNSARPFYTMHEDEKYSRSFDFMMRGNEISSGAQRVHDAKVLKDAILERGIKLDGKSGLEDYLQSFETGSVPHGGCGIGLERLVMLILGLSNVRTTTLFPRDPKRITP